MSNNNSKTSLYLQQGNLQFCGSVKIGQITLTNQQFKQLLLDNISWKRYIVYPKGQVCSIKHQNYTQFYYSLQPNNVGNDPTTNIEYWKPVVIDNNNSSNDLIFKIPYIQSGDSVFLEIQFSVDETFEDVYGVYSFTSSQNGDSNSSYNNNFGTRRIRNMCRIMYAITQRKMLYQISVFRIFAPATSNHYLHS